MKTKALWGLLLATMIGVLTASDWTRFANSSVLGEHPTILPIYGQVPSFTLIDQTGHPFAPSMLKGQVWIADFIFTSCAGQCPQMTAQMAALQHRFPRSVHLVSITVDPTRDSPAVLARYAKTNGAHPDRWHFLTGEPATIEPLVREGFRLAYGEGISPAEPITHSIRFVLVDREGLIRGYYDGTDPKAVRHLVQDAKSF